jgi:hypothetical protein
MIDSNQDQSEISSTNKGASVVHAELQRIRRLLTDSALPAKIQKPILASFDKLPSLYDDLNRTYESRFSDRIIGSIGGIVRSLGADDAGPEASQLAATMVNRMRAMHDRFGVAVALKPLPAAKPARKKKSA